MAAQLQRRYPHVQVQSDHIFIHDGPVWTSAGISSGIDLALALIEEDLGVEVSRAVARELVVYHRRPGGQSQFSALLELDPALTAPGLGALLAHLPSVADQALIREEAPLWPL